MYRISTVDQTSDKVRADYKFGFYLKWTLDKDNFNIKIWSYTPSHLYDHRQIDIEAWRVQTVGSAHKKDGVKFDSHDALSETEIQAVKIAITKFLGD